MSSRFNCLLMTFWSGETKCQLLCKFRAKQEGDFQGFAEQMDAHVGFCSFYVVNLLGSCHFSAPSKYEKSLDYMPPKSPHPFVFRA